MIRVKFLKDYKEFKKNAIELVSNNVAFGLIDSGVAIISKDMVENDYKTSDFVPTNKRKKIITKEK